jgi:hypothetical protein
VFCARTLKAMVPAATASVSFALFAAIRRASSRVRRFVGLLLVIDIRERLPVLVADDETSLDLVGAPRRREAARQRSISANDWPCGL